MKAKINTFWDRNGLFTSLLIILIGLCIFMFSITPVFAVENDSSHIIITETETTHEQTVRLGKMQLYVDADTPLTYKYLADNPNYSVTIKFSGQYEVYLHYGSGFYTIPSSTSELTFTTLSLDSLNKNISLSADSILCLSSYAGETYAVKSFSSSSSVDNDLILTTDGLNLTFQYGFYNLYVADGIPLTLQYLIDHPNYEITFTSDYNTNRFYLYTEDGFLNNYNFGSGSVINSETFADFIESNSDSSLLDEPLAFSNYGATHAVNWTLSCNTDYVDDGTVTPPIDDSSGVISGITSFIKDFFTALFQPIIQLVEAIQETLETTNAFIEMFGENVSNWWDNFLNNTWISFEPFEDYLDNLNDTALAKIMMIWDLPIVKDLLMVLVILMIIGGILTLLTTL